MYAIAETTVIGTTDELTGRAIFAFVTIKLSVFCRFVEWQWSWLRSSYSKLGRWLVPSRHLQRSSLSVICPRLAPERQVQARDVVSSSSIILRLHFTFLPALQESTRTLDEHTTLKRATDCKEFHIATCLTEIRFGCRQDAEAEQFPTTAS